MFWKFGFLNCLWSWVFEILAVLSSKSDFSYRLVTIPRKFQFLQGESFFSIGYLVFLSVIQYTSGICPSRFTCTSWNCFRSMNLFSSDCICLFTIFVMNIFPSIWRAMFKRSQPHSILITFIHFQGIGDVQISRENQFFLLPFFPDVCPLLYHLVVIWKGNMEEKCAIAKDVTEVSCHYLKVAMVFMFPFVLKCIFLAFAMYS